VPTVTVTEPPLLELRRVFKSFGGSTALGPIDLVVHEGSFLAVVGPSGCGKSTLLRIVAEFVAPTEGSMLRRLGEPVRRGDIGYVCQDSTLLPWAPVFDNVYLPLRMTGIGRAEAMPRVCAALTMVGLEDAADLSPLQLPSGLRTRLSIARAMVSRPRLLLLDEPFGALDETTRFTLEQDVLRLWREEGLTIVFVTRSVVDAVFLAGRVLVMTQRPGRIRADIVVDLPQPRVPALRTEPAFGSACRDVSAALAGTLAA